MPRIMELSPIASRQHATALRTASADHDLIITSGGVSVGEEDHIKPAVNAEGRLDLMADWYQAW